MNINFKFVYGFLSAPPFKYLVITSKIQYHIFHIAYFISAAQCIKP